MKKTLSVFALAGFLSLNTHAASYADTVLSYNPGSGFSVDYHGNAMTDSTRALGAPSTETVDPDPTFGGTFPVDPFGGPYLASQLVSLGTNGFITVSFNTPILNDPANPFGRDFSIFGNTFFVAPGPAFDTANGTLGGNNPGVTRVSVSADGVNFFVLDPTRAPVVDGLFPTDGVGNFTLPVDPSLTSADFAGLKLSGIRTLYNGSGGGTGFDIGWAQDTNGFAVSLPSITAIRVDVLNGVSEIDGFAAVSPVPEPGILALGVVGLLTGLGVQWPSRRSRNARLKTE